MERLIAVLGFIGVALAAQPVRASVVEPMSVEELARVADVVVVGTVVSRRSRYDDPPRSDRIVSDVVVRVTRTIRGASDPEVVVTTPGGVVEGRGQLVTGAPVLTPGEEVVLFLHPARPTSVGPRRMVVGLSQGLFLVRREPSGGPVRVRQNLEGVLLYGVAEGPGAELDLPLDDLIRRVQAVPHSSPIPRPAPAERTR